VDTRFFYFAQDHLGLVPSSAPNWMEQKNA
jgi:hypothetical protein